jgi:putative spermidine/putrescine transport system ATP-binding protein/spermidine/putrescine transport system ATP-binding protein
VFASDFMGKANLISGKLLEEDGKWFIADDRIKVMVNHVGGREGDAVRAAVRGEYFELCEASDEGANPFHLVSKVFTGLSWKLIGRLGDQPMDLSMLGISADLLETGADIYVRIKPENVVYYNE